MNQSNRKKQDGAIKHGFRYVICLLLVVSLSCSTIYSAAMASPLNIGTASQELGKGGTKNTANEDVYRSDEFEGAFHTRENETVTTLQESERNVEENTENNIQKNAEQNTEKKEDNLRLIIELEEDSILDEAIAKGQEYADLDEGFIEEKAQDIKKNQEEFIKNLSTEMDVDTSEKKHFDTIINAVSVTAKESDVSKIEAMDGVKQVYVSEEFQRPYIKASDVYGSYSYAWNTLHYKGEGIVVAVIDSGLDIRHRALRLDDESKVKLKKGDIEDIVRENHLKGKYYTSKVPYGYNYYDHNYNLLDSYGVMHGMHVAGIVGANDKDTKTYGVASNAQVLALKVFSDDLQYPTTFTDIWLKAIDDAITLKADVINMSLGSPAGFSVDKRAYPESVYIDKAREAGIVIAVATGNEASITEGNARGVKPLTENYDTSMVANPALAKNSLAVASMENITKEAAYIKWTNENNQEVLDEINLHQGKNSDAVIRAQIQDVFKGEDAILSRPRFFKGKIILIELPDEKNLTGFSKKLEKIVSFEPKAILVYNNTTNPESLGRRIVVRGGAENISIAKIRRSTYNNLIRASHMNPIGFTVEISSDTATFRNPYAGMMSTFSSWGPTPDLRIKPEITAVGGNVYSTIEDQQYENKSGTSMASPQVAGAAAIMKQYVLEQNLELDNYSDFIKTLLMNTAKPIADVTSNNAPYFVRQQGSGALNLEAALKAGIIVTATGTNDEEEDGKLELRQIDEKKFQVKLRFRNFSDTAKTYIFRPEAIYEPTKDGRRSMKASVLDSVTANIREEITIPAGETLEREFALDYGDADALEENNFLEGFLHLDAKGDEIPLSIPFLAFYGDWTGQKAIDAFSMKEFGKESREAQFLVNEEGHITSSMFINKLRFALPVLDDTVYFSTNSKYYDSVLLRLAPLRNMSEIEYSIVEPSTKETLRVIGISNSVRKLSRLWVNNSFRIMPDSLWDGTIGGNPIEENKEYLYQLKVKLNNEGIGGTGEQIYQYPIRLDTTKPELSDAKDIEIATKDQRKKELTFKVRDEGSGVRIVYLESVRFVDGKQKYGKAIKLHFVDTPTWKGKVIPKVEDGRVYITDEFLPSNLTEDKDVFIYRNGHRNKEVEIQTGFIADSTHLHINVIDYVDNKKSIIIPTGETGDYKSIHFLNFHNSLKEAKAEVYVNDEKVGMHIYNTTESTAKVRIQIPNQDKHISHLHIKRLGSNYTLISEDTVRPEAARKFHLEVKPDTNTIEFSIDELSSNVEVTTATKPGALPQPPKMIRLDMSSLDFTHFKTLKIHNIVQEIPSPAILDIRSGRVELDFIKESGKNRLIDKVIVHEKGVAKELSRANHFDLKEGRVSGFSDSRYSLIVATNLSEDARLEIKYVADIEGGSTSSHLESLQASPSNASPSNARENVFGQMDTNTEKNKKIKYPVIYLRSPELLSVLSSQNVVDDKLLVDGFVTNIKKNDDVERIHISLVDEYGNIIGDEIVLNEGDITKENIDYKEGETSIYNGMGYAFQARLPISGFNLNVRVAIETKQKESASIVRRLFYDKISPELDYFVEERTLDSDFVQLKLRAKDNALKLKLYHNDSLLLHKDISEQSLIGRGIEVSKNVKIKLKPGQNEIRISAVDLANHSVEKVIYIYRSE